MESIKESEQQLKVKMSTPKLSSGEQSDSIDYDTPAQQQLAAQEDREKDESMRSLKEAEAELHHELGDKAVPQVGQKK